MGGRESHKWLSDKMKAKRDYNKVNAIRARRAKHSTPAENAEARDQIADYLSRVPRAPIYVDDE